MSFGWGTKWTSWKNPISFKLHPLEFCLLRYHDGLQNQRSRQNDGGHPKQNPANNYGNRFSSSWSRQNKFDRGKPIKPPTCYFSRKVGRLISSCPEKWRVAPKRDGFLANTLSLTAVGEDTHRCHRIQYTPVYTSSVLSDTLVISESLSTCASVLTRGISSKYTTVPPYTVYTSIHQ